MAYALSGELDQLGANNGVSSQTLVPADDTAIPPLAAVMESDDDFRARIVAAFEGAKRGWATGIYEYYAKSAEGRVADTSAISPKVSAMRVAKAKWEKLLRGVAGFSFTLAMKRADFYPETPVKVSGFKSVIDAQPWLISKDMRNLSSSGYATKLKFEVLLSDIEYVAYSEKNYSGKHSVNYLDDKISVNQ